MAVSDVEAVLEFLRKNGLSDSESALMEDIYDKSELRAFDYEKFLFPAAFPPPPPLKIPATRHRLEPTDGVADSSSDCSEEFVSLGSSTTELCSSEFTNPYGIRAATRVNSQASSERLSEFGTARDYHEFDMYNDLNWYSEKDEDYITPSHFGGPGSCGCPSEDKFIMTLGTEKKTDNQLGSNHIPEGFQSVERSKFLDKPWSFNVSSIGDVNDAHVTDYYHLDEKVQVQGCNGMDKEDCIVYSCSGVLCPCCVGSGGLGGDSNDYCLKNLKVDDINNFQYGEIGKCNSDSHIKLAKEDLQSNENDGYEVGNGGEADEDPNELDTAAVGKEGVTVDDFLMNITNDEEYEVFNLRIIHRKNRTGFEENKDLPIVINSVIAGRYCVTEYLGSAAFSKVVQAHDLQTGMDVCLKIIKNDKDFFDQSLDEIKLLKFVNKNDPGDQRHILRLYDYFYYQEHLFIVSELLRANLYEFQKYNQESGGEPYFTLSRLQVITRQCLEALEYLHYLGIIHCDLKPENILIKSYRRCEIKVIDLGSSCFQTDNLCLYVQSRSYRAPEVILGLPYDQKIDLWSLGCILAELCSGEVLFPNDALVVLLARMIGMLGPIETELLVKGQETDKYFTNEYDLYHINEETNQLEYIIPEESSLEHHLQVSDVKFIDFLKDLLEINPERRPTAAEALKHPWLTHQYDS
ncbi:uncharacterized protein LOC132270783 [Cornus florida]|uniref:uncharacterized protein LOC132270783 n=1 Tax=Cornus florida TaxID=4283 RepID=UPI0028A240DC|nr:uncharacterized protein LOC132270783 [Cornus florida]